MDNSFVNALLSQAHLPSPLFCLAEASLETIAMKVCACLNEAGGWIVIGVNDDLSYTGLPNADFDKQIQTEITEHISPLPLVYVQKEEYVGNPVVLVTILKGGLPPYTYKGKYYVLSGLETTKPSPDYLSRLLRDSSSFHSEWERINNLYANEDDLDKQLMNKVYEKGLSLGRLNKDQDGLKKVLSELHLLNTTEVSNGAVAMFAYETKGLLPQCRLRIQLMTKGKEANQYEDLFFIEGNVFNVQKKTIDYFKDRLPRVAYFFADKTGRYNDLEYPIGVLDEAISNALIHRDYTDIADEVTVFIYADRVEITNSGELPEKMLASKNRVLPHSSVLRNPLMAEIFYIAGEMEKTGRGMMLISSTMKEAGRKLPEWTSSNGKTTLKIFNKKEKLVENDRIVYFKGKMKKGCYFTKKDYLEVFESKLSKGTVQNDLLLMIKLGVIEKIGEGPSTKYRLR